MKSSERIVDRQPPPRPGGAVVLDDLIVCLRERSQFGEKKYGTVLKTHNGRDAHLDALQELLDLFVYLHQAEMERAELERENAGLRAALATAEQMLEKRRATSVVTPAEPERPVAPPGASNQDIGTSDMEREGNV